MSRCVVVLAFAALLAAQHSEVEKAWNLVANGKRAEAVVLLRKIVQSDVRNADARLLLGSILMEDGDRAGSLEELEAAVRLRPRSADAQNALGEAYNAFGEAEKARVVFEQAVALNPKFAQAQLNLGVALLEAKNGTAAAAHLDRAIVLFGAKPDSAYPRYLRAKIFTDQSQPARAAAELEKAVQLRPDFAEAWSDLGQARKALLDDAGALKAFERAVAAAPDDAVAQSRLGSEYLRQGKTHDAVTHLQIAVRLDPDNQSALNSLQLALRQDGRSEEAVAVKKQLTELLRKRDVASQNNLAAVRINNEGAELEKAGKLPAALEKYRAAIQLSPDHVGIRINYAVALLRLGHWREGIAELREAERRDPSNAQVKAALADALKQAPADVKASVQP